jgi:hypothetical protein
VLQFVLVAEQIHQEIEVFQIVLTLVEEGLQVSIDAFVYIPVVIFLHAA